MLSLCSSFLPFILIFVFSFQLIFFSACIVTNENAKCAAIPRTPLQVGIKGELVLFFLYAFFNCFFHFSMIGTCANCNKLCPGRSLCGTCRSAKSRAIKRGGKMPVNGRPPKELVTGQVKYNRKYRAKKEAKAKLEEIMKLHPELGSEREEMKKQAAIGRSVGKVYQQLPKNSPVRKPLVGNIVRNLDEDVSCRFVGDTFGIKTSTVKVNVKSTETNNFLNDTKQVPKQCRRTLKVDEIDQIREFWLERTVAIPWKAFTVKKRGKEAVNHAYHEQRDSDDAIFKSFVATTGSKRCKATVLKHKPFNIRDAKQVYCVCHHCSEGHISKKQLSTIRQHLHADCVDCSKDERCIVERAVRDEKKKKIEKLKKEIAEYRSHKVTADHQAAAYSLDKSLQKLNDGECVICKDFAGRFIVSNEISMSQKAFFARVGVPDLILVKYWKEDGKIKSETYDFFSETEEKDDFHYVRSCWLWLLNETNELDDFHTIRVWSDGGPKHFKIRRTIFFFSVLQEKYGKKFIWNFFQSCHGKGPCDGHTGVIKKKLKLEAKKQNPVMTDYDMYEFAKEHVKSQSFWLEVDHKQDYDCKTFKDGIKKYFEFSFDGIGEILCRERSGNGPFIRQKIEAIENGDYIEYHPKQVVMDLSD
eukprot:Lithocolla_globosa_v1_NODE_1429_length_2580_cov_31.909307.p1 type:complete len:642 gc:universal NODE_1429_length_2580_cov_31.909307:1952-27(-)